MLEPPKVGENICNLRKKKNISISELSKRSGVSKSMLSQIEQEKANPTVTTVWKISRALDIPVEELLESNGSGQIEVLRKDDTPVIYSDDRSCKIKINSPIHMTDNLELYHMYLSPKGINISNAHIFNAEEFLTVIRGTLKVTAGGHEKILYTGDTARYKVDREHKIENTENEDAEAFLVVWYPK